MTQEEFRKTVARMLRSVQDTTFVLEDTKQCKGVHCADCPIFKATNTDYSGCMINDTSIFDAFEVIEAVEKWGEEHPLKTNAEKFKEVWGCEPKSSVDGEWICPSHVGVRDCHGMIDCKACSEEFWLAEYKEPKAER